MKEKHTTTRYFATDGPRPTSLIEVDENYFRECRLAGAAAVEVLTPAGTCEAVCGTRYLQPGTSIATEVVDGRLEITYQGALLRTVLIGERYTFWPATG
ncbi:hypothetical protein [Mycobacteroides chelonae]|uniref:hypothetical protein n=1 Tax=Mycobacteroides chelonae TaxID=1774 RepID=UPI0008A8BE02|nr:hypothetical protein [Mycobacteroides chelonae]OHU12815.1 hypothetical protein BKG75_17530 [Mycobacteroides chelonae]